MRDDLIQLRRGTAAEWTAADPVLDAGEPGYELDTDQVKIGNGTDVWSALPYFGAGGGGAGGSGGPAFTEGFYIAVPSGPSVASNAGGWRGVAPFWVDREIHLTRIGITVTSGADTGRTVRLGLYADSNGRPGEVVVDAGTVDASTTGYKELVIDVTLTPGRYWAHFGPNSAAIACRSSRPNGIVGALTGAGAIEFSANTLLLDPQAANADYPLADNPALSGGNPEDAARIALLVSA